MLPGLRAKSRAGKQIPSRPIIWPIIQYGTMRANMSGGNTIKWLLVFGLVATGSLPTSPAQARTEARTQYTKAQTFSGALRYLRVDLGYEVTEKDPEAAYVLFQFVPAGKQEPTTGSFEIIRSGAQTRLFVQLAQLPSYYEAVLRDGLLRKLREEYGEPVRKSAKPKETPAQSPDQAKSPKPSN
jgi:hypothetical protein